MPSPRKSQRLKRNSQISDRQLLDPTPLTEKSLYFSIFGGQLIDSIRILETYAGDKTEVTITNASGHVLRSNNPELEYYTQRGAPRRVNNTIWWQRAYNHGVGYPFAEDIRYDALRRVHLLPIALPIRTAFKASAVSDEKNTVGVLRIVLLLPELKNIVESSLELEETHTLLTNESGKIIAASPGSGYQVDTYIEMNNAAEEAIIEAKKGKHGKYYDYEAEGETDSFNEPRVYGWARTQLSPCSTLESSTELQQLDSFYFTADFFCLCRCYKIKQLYFLCYHCVKLHRCTDCMVGSAADRDTHTESGRRGA